MFDLCLQGAGLLDVSFLNTIRYLAECVCDASMIIRFSQTSCLCWNSSRMNCMVCINKALNPSQVLLSVLSMLYYAR